MSSAFRAHPDSIATRIKAQQQAEAMQALAKLADQPQQDDGPNWLDITLDSPAEDVEAALQAEIDSYRPVEDLPAVALLDLGMALSVDDVTGGVLHPNAMPDLVAELWFTNRSCK